MKVICEGECKALDTVRDLLETLGYERVRAEGPDPTVLEFKHTGKESPWCYAKLLRDEVDDLVEMVDASIEAVKGMEDNDEILSWFYSIRADLRIAKAKR